MTRPGHIRAAGSLLGGLFWMLLATGPGCNMDLRRPTNEDAGAGRCSDGPKTTCHDMAACSDARPCSKCPDGGPCADIALCPTCKDSGTCSDSKPCPACPDASKPDAKPKPDALVIKSLVDDTFADFKQGTLAESGAKIYVSAKGNVQLLDRLDVNGDGWLDILFSNSSDGTSGATNSYLYWGTASGSMSSKPSPLPTVTAYGNAMADLNDDGHVDLVFCNTRNKKTYKINSYVYWGSATGFSTAKPTGLPTHGANTTSIADLNRDGHLDIVFANGGDSGNVKVNAYIYWGSASGYSAGNRAKLPVLMATHSSVADLDGDGHLDLVFANASDGSTHNINSYIYWGSAKGFSPTNRKLLPTSMAHSSTVADLDRDGHLDLIFGNNVSPKQLTKGNSYIYWGPAKSASVANRTELPAYRTYSGSVADLNRDGHLDIISLNNFNPPNYKMNSYIYWGSSSGYSISNKIDLPTHAVVGSIAADYNADGYLDVVFCNNGGQPTGNINSYVYWGSATGYSATKRAELPTMSVGFSTTADPGSVHDRSPVQTFTSRAMDTGSAAPTYALLTWKATVPKKTSLKLQLRSAATAAGLAAAIWYGPSTWDRYTQSGTPINKVHDGHRFIQYRATFSHDFGNTPILDKVEVSYHP